MNDPRVKPGVLALTIRWAARGWSIASVAFVLVIAIGEIVSPSAPPPATFRDLAGLFFFPCGVCVGLILAWRWEGLGGGIAVGSLAAFYALLGAMDGRFPRGPFFALVAAPGVLFLLSWAVTAASKKKSSVGHIQNLGEENRSATNFTN